MSEAALTDVHVTDDKCSPVQFVGGDDTSDSKLDYSETWRYTCTTKLSETTQSVATAIGTAYNLPAAHKAYATVVVGSDAVPPLVNIINVSKISYPLSLPSGGGAVTFTYKVNNPGVVSLSDVTVTDDKGSAMSGKLGDTNGNNLLDIREVWTYTCTTHLNQTTTNTATITAFAHGLKAVGYATLTVTVDIPAESPVPGFPAQAIPSLPETGVGSAFKFTVWGALTAIIAVLGICSIVRRKRRVAHTNEHKK